MNPETPKAMKEAAEKAQELLDACEQGWFDSEHLQQAYRFTETDALYIEAVNPANVSALIADYERLQAEFEVAGKQMAEQCNEAYQKAFAAQREAARACAERDALAAEIERQAGEIAELNKHVGLQNNGCALVDCPVRQDDRLGPTAKGK